MKPALCLKEGHSWHKKKIKIYTAAFTNENFFFFNNCSCCHKGIFFQITILVEFIQLLFHVYRPHIPHVDWHIKALSPRNPSVNVLQNRIITHCPLLKLYVLGMSSCHFSLGWGFVSGMKTISRESNSLCLRGGEIVVQFCCERIFTKIRKKNWSWIVHRTDCN